MLITHEESARCDFSGCSAPLRAQVEERLCSQGYSDLKELECQYQDGALTLRGKLPSYYLKQIALATAAEVGGIDTLVDQIEVRPVT